MTLWQVQLRIINYIKDAALVVTGDETEVVYIVSRFMEDAVSAALARHGKFPPQGASSLFPYTLEVMPPGPDIRELLLMSCFPPDTGENQAAADGGEDVQVQTQPQPQPQIVHPGYEDMGPVDDYFNEMEDPDEEDDEDDESVEGFICIPLGAVAVSQVDGIVYNANDLEQSPFIELVPNQESQD